MMVTQTQQSGSLHSESEVASDLGGLVWFRADLRVVDNKALSEACKRCDRVMALYIATPMQWHEHHVSPIQVDLIRRRLAVLRQQLKALNIPLMVLELPDFHAIPEAVLAWMQQHQLKHVFANKQYEWNEGQRDDLTARLLNRHQICFSAFDYDCVIAPGEVLTRSGDPFKVFTPFRRQWLTQYRQQPPQPEARPEPVAQRLPDALYSEQPISLTYPEKSSVDWPVDEEALIQRLRTFCMEKAPDYHQKRDFPAVDGTSCLSPYLAIGALSSRQCLSALFAESPFCLDEPESGEFTWCNEIIWREFYRHLIVAWPKLSRDQPFQPWTKHVRWHESESLLSAWQRGETGFPIVDAAMRQLRETGWMHNRLRMITASFLTKDLLIHWQAGEQWFMSHLIDGDLASNNGGWQWAASTGTDAQPYFRVFNPTTQGERFDPKGEFIRKWVHELKDVPDKYIHEPHRWPQAHRLNYPKPIVDHKSARLRAIEEFKAAKAQD
ncbi:deoxyribodipyrimidine photo-lyase [Photobacterium sp. TY1-4]|uniref:deoxyribodipyrimidine photo-lyase n=1 Tax=Photobacterium sp. TY1-4 TaxID=2899122 RepID=UPI0021BFFEA0|nr:deoxyribodipyrimidine photo-lyase [Photobacterium sp. TY1-4]UXI04061.1 deoxyribodipyrimidine photo-lyase [Photobacterium sp. TY1-4]